MLVLSRRVQESIQIGDTIEVKVLAIEGDQIKIGIDAPLSIEIHRKEIYLEIQNQNSEAAQAPSHLLKLLQNK